MEKVLTENDRIRRAEELYYRRNGISAPQKKESDKKNSKKNYKFRILLLINLIVLVFCIQKKEYIFSEVFLQDVNTFINQKININEKIANIRQYFKDNMYVVQNTQETTSLTEENSNVSSDSEISNDEGIQAELVENPAENVQEENNENLSQDDIDIKSINENYNLIWPLEGTITSYFGQREENDIVTQNHTGIDIGAITGTKIKAALDGKVILVSNQGAYGNHIKIEKDNIITLYAHCKEIYVNENDEIMQGQEIASVGSTGNSTGPHLHFEIRRDDRFVDPIKILE